MMVVIAAAGGAVVAAFLSCVPGLHVYNLLGALAWAACALEARHAVPTEWIAAFACGTTVSYAVVSAIPSVLLAAPDESALFTVLPGQKLLAAGRGYEGTLLSAAGSLGALYVLVLAVAPAAPRWLPLMHRVFRPHAHWVVWCVICFMLMSEWPKTAGSGAAGFRRLAEGWSNTGMGLLTFLLSGLLGFVLQYRSPIPVRSAFQGYMPAFAGLFTLPWLVLNILSRVEPVRQIVPGRASSNGRPAAAIRPSPFEVATGVLAGCAGGGFAAFFPAVTGGVGSLLAGHAFAVRNDRTFLISQGAARLMYYAGALLFFFVPGDSLTRGGAAWLLRGLGAEGAECGYPAMAAAVAVAGAAACLLVDPLTRMVLFLLARFGYRRISCVSLAAIVLLVPAVTGPQGLGVMAVAGAIGLLPVLSGARRMNALGVILLPMACRMSGVGCTVAGWLGLMR